VFACVRDSGVKGYESWTRTMIVIWPFSIGFQEVKNFGPFLTLKKVIFSKPVLKKS